MDWPAASLMVTASVGGDSGSGSRRRRGGRSENERSGSGFRGLAVPPWRHQSSIGRFYNLDSFYAQFSCRVPRWRWPGCLVPIQEDAQYQD